MKRFIIAAMFAASLCTSRATALPPPATITSVRPPLADLSWDWDWDAFRKFWRGQLGRTSGVAGVVSLVIGFGVLIVMSSRKKT